MAGKFLTTQNKKIITTIGLLLSGWLAITYGGNTFNIPSIPTWATNPLMFGVSLIMIGGIITILAVIMLWTEY